ncbi:MAG: hypothetical protein Q8K60_06860, partial [Parachlamydiaceae bacterium]|nr:hypothetical protein [Parachlamydiaceae bacterium]
MTIRKTLIEIQNSLSFEKLEPFKEGTIWSTFGDEERNLFAHLLLMQGEQQLAEGNAQVIESFKTAAEVSCQSPMILFRQGKILSQYKENIRCLNLAIQAFSKAIEQNPLFFEAWIERAHTLILIGMFEFDQTYLTEAKEHFEHVYSFMDITKVDLGQFYNKWGECLYALGKISGEPCDLQQALSKFRLANEYGCEEVEFINEYGQCFAALAMLLRKPEYFEDAFHLFDRAVQYDSNHFDSWFNRACCLQQMFEIHPTQFLEREAEDSFVRAAEINQELSLLWFKWGQLESFVGKIKRDNEKIESSFEKFEKANQLDPNQPGVLCAWGLIQLFLGAQKEDISLIQSAQEKVIRALEIHPEDGQIWYMYGCCLNELGRYFSDLRYLDQ